MDLAERVFSDVRIPSDSEEAQAAIKQLTDVSEPFPPSAFSSVSQTPAVPCLLDEGGTFRDEEYRLLFAVACERDPVLTV